VELYSPALDTQVHRQFVIGGASIYATTLALPSSSTVIDRMLLTRILSPAFDDCDVYMPDLLSGNWRRASHEELNEWTGVDVPEGVQEENGVTYEFQMWLRGEDV
jgi:dihydrofolate reductase